MSGRAGRTVAELRLDAVIGRMATAWAGHRLAARARVHLATGLPQPAVLAFDHVGRQVAMWGRYEREELQLVFGALAPHLGQGPAGVALDIGANIGNHALYFAEHFSEVLAFEPHPRTHALLAFNAALNPRIRCFDFGLSDREGTATLHVPPGNAGMASLHAAHGAAGSAALGGAGESAAVPCRLRRLDDLPELAAAAGRRVAIVKIDVEGHEAAVLRGAAGVIARDRPVVLFEQSAADIHAGTSSAVELLRAAGYLRLWTIEAWPAGRSRWLTLARRALFGEGLRLVEVTRIEARFHSMLVALHGDGRADAAPQAGLTARPVTSAVSSPSASSPPPPPA